MSGSPPQYSLPCGPGEVDDFLSVPTEGVVDFARKIEGDVLILGAGGKMGLHLAAMLRRALDMAGKSNRLEAVSRFGSAGVSEAFEKRGVRTIVCDLADPSQLAGLPERENLIFMAGAKFGTAGRPDLLRRMNVEMPWDVASRFRASRITAFSTGCVYSYAHAGSGGSGEESEIAPVGLYAQSCLGREEAFTRAAREFGTRVTLIRLNYSVEFRYGVLVDIAAKVLRGEPLDVTMGYFNVIWQRDAVAFALRAHALASEEPFVLNVTGPETHAVKDVALRFGELFGRAPAFTGREEETAWLSDASKCRRLFGPPETPFDQMAGWVAEWLKAGYPLLGKPTGFERRDGTF